MSSACRASLLAQSPPFAISSSTQFSSVSLPGNSLMNVLRGILALRVQSCMIAFSSLRTRRRIPRAWPIIGSYTRGVSFKNLNSSASACSSLPLCLLLRPCFSMVFRVLASCLRIAVKRSLASSGSGPPAFSSSSSSSFESSLVTAPAGGTWSTGSR